MLHEHHPKKRSVSAAWIIYHVLVREESERCYAKGMEHMCMQKWGWKSCGKNQCSECDTMTEEKRALLEEACAIYRDVEI